MNTRGYEALLDSIRATAKDIVANLDELSNAIARDEGGREGVSPCLENGKFRSFSLLERCEEGRVVIGRRTGAFDVFILLESNHSNKLV